MDKHEKRYLSEFHGHMHEGINMGEMMSYLRTEPSEPGYLQSIIQSEFSGDQKQFLLYRLWSKEGGDSE